MLILFYRAIFGLLICLVLGFFAYLTKQLTASGAAALCLIGTLLTTFGSWFTWILICLFFCSSGAIHLFKKFFFAHTEDSIADKGATRDAAQVFANSLPAIISLLLYAITSNELFLIGYVAGIAGATADTWASEIGQLSTTAPRSVLTLKKLPTGTSGGVTFLGTLASIGGALLISSSFWLLASLSQQMQPTSASYFVVPSLCGMLASFIDSLLGASFQARYQCSVCHQWTESLVHHGQKTQLIKGFSWLNNDKVNLISGCLTILIGWLLWITFIH
ncbi:hypothetical protein BAU15_00715 [Enterococcus sp. JM4C]|uniref:DUF92 domain-containing protein n=1 Tax=Candidatus Enterococcus huntleyi TaxID=1857217 RepID=UPI00137B13C0|nr:DUF92 domain-containing protein [Enterococcus sp. JM4C]KAF1299201.1 hypothetical protein BAU15_00715 [Enterococcus sp. JM4C]